MWSKRKLRVAGLMTLIGLAIGLMGCAGSTAPPASDGCLIFRAINAAPTLDSAETIRQIDAHNSVGASICDW